MSKRIWRKHGKLITRGGKILRCSHCPCGEDSSSSGSSGSSSGGSSSSSEPRVCSDQCDGSIVCTSPVNDHIVSWGEDGDWGMKTTTTITPACFGDGNTFVVTSRCTLIWNLFGFGFLMDEPSAGVISFPFGGSSDTTLTLLGQSVEYSTAVPDPEGPYFSVVGDYVELTLTIRYDKPTSTTNKLTYLGYVNWLFQALYTPGASGRDFYIRCEPQNTPCGSNSFKLLVDSETFNIPIKAGLASTVLRYPSLDSGNQVGYLVVYGQTVACVAVDQFEFRVGIDIGYVIKPEEISISNDDAILVESFDGVIVQSIGPITTTFPAVLQASGPRIEVTC